MGKLRLLSYHVRSDRGSRRPGQRVDPMMHRRRGELAALFLSGLIAGSSALSSAADSTELAPGESVLPDGLTTQVHKATASGAVALEVWIRCPANGWSSSQPGIARLTALAAVGAKPGGTSLRDAVRVAG